MREELEKKLSEHEQRMLAIEVQNQEIMNLNIRNTEQFASLIGEIHDLTTVFRVYAEKHDNLKESNAKLWTKVDTHSKELQSLAIVNALNAETLSTVKDIKGQAVKLIVAAILSPVAMGAALIFTK